MDIISLSYPTQASILNADETVAAIGFFDGVHKGHQKVIQTAKEIAAKQQRKSAVITFSPHPSVVLKKQQKTVHYLTPLTEKKAILEDMGIDILYVITFNEDLSRLSPKEFIQTFINGLHIKHLVAGFDFTYGYMGKGTMETIRDDAEGSFDVTIIDKLDNANKKISSTLIRELLSDGKVYQIKELLGRPFQTSGIVVEGEKRGRTIGFPTANIEIGTDYALPKVGVYAVTVSLANKQIPGMANIGYKPTFHDNTGDQPTVEIHLFDFNEHIYGEKVQIDWHHFIRDEIKFAGVDELIGQLKQDEQQIRQFLPRIFD
ncbi:riboflavin biosynthesis protein [Paraliobacillus quinghaiensis]|uniref:Riboflavin biosynthesis protein n=1 Tax=Paraliobacillus quinghaiensis TaxID=470815 RepID=A0A917TGQ5_9BACI|nr:bifunctional riboflavin kinase/FAD synthetase [Paraliobacillus quinghaiensis]GGM21759.1 riboflavin biosynthesis protein [Paraliobacillus quinghaiensis]